MSISDLEMMVASIDMYYSKDQTIVTAGAEVDRRILHVVQISSILHSAVLIATFHREDSEFITHQ